MKNEKRWPRLLSRLVFLGLFGTFSSHGGTVPPSVNWECPGLMVRTVGPPSVTVGGEVRYRIRLSNEGVCDLSEAQLTHFLPRRTTFKDARPAPSYHTGSPTTLPPDLSAPLPFPSPLPVESIEWRKIELPAAGHFTEYEVILEIQPPGDRVITSTACAEHPRSGRICDTLDTYVRK